MQNKNMHHCPFHSTCMHKKHACGNASGGVESAPLRRSQGSGGCPCSCRSRRICGPHWHPPPPAPCLERHRAHSPHSTAQPACSAPLHTNISTPNFLFIHARSQLCMRRGRAVHQDRGDKECLETGARTSLQAILSSSPSTMMRTPGFWML
jgi:hypothetical protein